MIYFPTWKVILVLAVCALGVIYAAPNLLSRHSVLDFAEGVPQWLPAHQVNLGLDLQGGSHLLIRVEYEEVIREQFLATEDLIRGALRDNDVGYTELGADGQGVGFRLRQAGDADRVREIIAELDPQLEVTIADDGQVRVTLPPAALDQIRSNAVSQSIEIIRERIDETGTNEPVIQRQGTDRILVQLPGVDDPERIKDLLVQTARLTFHLVDENASLAEALAGRVPAGSILLPGRHEGPEGTPVPQYVVQRRAIVGGENLTNAQPTFQDGRPVVAFNFDAAGGRRFGEVTTENVGRRLAIVLDDEVISAPVIQSPITGGSGIITGGFTSEQASDLALLLRAGALPAPLTYLEERTVGPGLGDDSIAAGKMASVIAFILVLVFMVVSYGLFGVMACIALVFNLALILACLSVLQATLTLPGIAGIVLTLGMAVDANVLIFERMREEIRNGRSVISAIDAGYSRAWTTIVDSNLTTLIAGILLFAFGSGPVRGFAVTLSIGILTSMFTAVMVTRLLVVTWLQRRRPQALPI